MPVLQMLEWAPTGDRDTARFDAIQALLRLDEQPAEGLLVLTAGHAPDGRWRVLSVWRSAADYERFATDRLGPAIGATADEGHAPVPPSYGEQYELHLLRIPT